jgi:hypothetical protein
MQRAEMLALTLRPELILRLNQESECSFQLESALPYQMGLWH